MKIVVLFITLQVMLMASFAQTNASSVSGTISPVNPAPGADASWQKTLNDTAEDSMGIILVPVYDSEHMFFSIPAEKAKILETEPAAKLIPFLRNQYAGRVYEAKYLLMVVQDRLHGTPRFEHFEERSKEGKLLKSWDIPVYSYSKHVGLLMRDSPGLHVTSGT